MNRLALAGIVLSAVGLATLAYSDPVIRFLVLGGAAFGSAAGGVSAGTFLVSNSTRAAAFAARSASGPGSTTFVATLIAFGAAVVGLVLIVTAFVVGGGESTADSERQPVS